MQRLISSVDKKADDTIICGYEYTYDQLGQISTEKNLATNQTICYTYDKLSRLIKREVKNSADEIISTESFAYDAAGNIISAPTGSFQYDTQNKLTMYNGESVEYDLDGNMISMPVDGIPEEYNTAFYDSSNRLISAMDNTYTYDAENNRIKFSSWIFDLDFVYNTNCKLSQVLAMIENGSPIFYIHGLGLIGEEQNGQFYTYHYDYRGSTVAMTDQSGNIVLTAEYDVYGKVTSINGDRRLWFGYNGRDGVQTDVNGLLYMRARYYCPNRRRFVNADIIQGNIEDSTSLNRYAYVNGNPVSLVDPFGLSAERGVSLLEWLENNIGFAFLEDYEYDEFSFENFYFGYKYGEDLSRKIGDSNKPIQIFGEFSFDEGGINLGFGLKVNLSDKSGFKIGFNNNEVTIEGASDGSSIELILGNMKAGITLGQGVDWKNNTIGVYEHYYIRPANIAGTVVLCVVSYGSLSPVAFQILSQSTVFA